MHDFGGRCFNKHADQLPFPLKNRLFKPVLNVLLPHPSLPLPLSLSPKKKKIKGWIALEIYIRYVY